MTALRPGNLILSALLGGFIALSPLSAQAPAAAAPAAGGDFFIHQFHAKQLQLDCNTCHVPVSEGSVTLKRPGHEQCMICHSDAFGAARNQKICAQCHTGSSPTASDVMAFPRFKKKEAILFEFSHAKHVDTQGRNNPATGFRADCTFCHKFDAQGVYATFPQHTECATCHAKAGMKPTLSAASTTADCRGCHTPEEIENPGFTEERRMIAPHVVSGTLVNIKYSHEPHLRNREKFNLNCTTCHYAVPASNSLTNLTLPKMIDCVECHDNDKSMPAEFQMSNCSTCHIDKQNGAAPGGHTRFVKPAFHVENFRQEHSEEASAPGAKCFVCHTNMVPPPAAAITVAASVSAKDQCISCHQVMRPASHTTQWKADVHGKFASIDREQCATCHTADYCSSCHNERPRSHEPLAVFKGGGHANLALLDERSCLTCHTFQNTCAECHVK